MAGGCLCGAVRFEVELPTLFCAHCHCTLCRLAHGAGYVTWFGVSRERLRFLQGEGALVPYASTSHGERRFCGRCGSSIFCESSRLPEVVDITLASMDGPIDRDPQMHAFYDTAVSWAPVPDDLPKTSSDVD